MTCLAARLCSLSVPMRQHTGPVTTLAEAMLARVYLWAFCRLCGRAKRLHPAKMIAQVGEDRALATIAARMRCTECGRKHVLLVAGAEHLRSALDTEDERHWRNELRHGISWRT